MIDELHVRDVALIRDASLAPSAGLTALTGETGAGKSALLSAIKLLVGERADAGAVREGADGLEVEGRFYVRGGDPDGCVVSRRVGADGRGRVRIDGRMGSVRELAEGVGATVDLCGQHEHQRLLQVQTHVEMLDAWVGEPAAAALDSYREALAAAADAARELDRVRELSRTGAAALEEAEFVCRRIDEVDPADGELAELEAKLPRAEHGDALLRSALGAREALAGEGGALDAIRDAASDGGAAVERAQKAADAAEARLADAARALDDVRREAAPRFSAAVSEQMARLEMGSAELEVAFERLPRAEWSRRGPSRAEFLYRPGAGLSARPLRRIASGGEVSRVMLALKVVLGESDSAETLVFDEVDAGVGGATAVALAGVLADLARTHQVIVVTHLAQVAVVADEHYLVSKSAGDVPETTLTAISGEDRVREVARMLSGDTGEASLAHARELLS